MNSTILILIYLAAALLVTGIPFLRVYLSLCYTLLYEVICVLFLKGGFGEKIKLQRDGSWQAANHAQSRFRKALIAYAGYTGTSLTAIGLFYLESKGHYDSIIYSFIGLLVLSLLLWIRNFFGFIWALSFVSLLAVPIYFRYELAIIHISIFLASLILIQSVLNSLQLCRQSFMHRKNPARTAVLAQGALIPAVVWGIVLLSQSLFAGYFIFKNILS